MVDKFALGRTVITPAALTTLHAEDVDAAMQRHASGDWGEVSSAHWTENDLSLNQGFRLLSEYRDRHDRRFWIITEADRSATTVLLPEDY